MQADFDGCVRGIVPDVAVVQPVDPDAAGPGPGPAGQARGQQLRLLRADRRRPRRRRPPARPRWPSASWPGSPRRPPNFPDLIERQFNYPAYAYERMFGCTGGDFTHGLLQPEFMGPFRPGPRGWPDDPIPVERPLPVRRRLPRRPGDHLHPRVQLRPRRPRRPGVSQFRRRRRGVTPRDLYEELVPPGSVWRSPLATEVCVRRLQQHTLGPVSAQRWCRAPVVR